MTTYRYSPEDSTLIFVWHGGAYIDIGDRGGVPFEVINVWSHASGEPRIKGKRAFEARCQEWLDELTPEDLANYRESVRGMRP